MGPGTRRRRAREIDLTHITTRDIAGITKRDIFGYLDYVRSVQNGPKSRARKLSALKGFFGYMVTQVNKLSQNPTEDISLGTPKPALPKYLTREESLSLLKIYKAISMSAISVSSHCF